MAPPSCLPGCRGRAVALGTLRKNPGQKTPLGTALSLLGGDPRAKPPGAVRPRGSPVVQPNWERAGCREAGGEFAPGEVPAWGKWVHGVVS